MILYLIVDSTPLSTDSIVTLSDPETTSVIVFSVAPSTTLSTLTHSIVPSDFLRGSVATAASSNPYNVTLPVSSTDTEPSSPTGINPTGLR